MSENALGKATDSSDRGEKSLSMDGVTILHCFADRGVESEALTAYGEVIRVGLDPKDTNDSIPIKADAKTLPFADGVTFDLGLFHPPCTKWSDMPSVNPEDHQNLIPLAREIAQQYCDHYIIENKPRAPLIDAVTLNGGMFGLPIEYERAFETTFSVDQPPRYRTFGTTDGQPFFDSEHSTEWWATAKGYSPNYPNGPLSRNCVPRAYLEYLLRNWIEAVDNEERPCYANYDKEMDAKRSKESNSELSMFN